jgi:Ca2+-transporting ATPase
MDEQPSRTNVDIPAPSPHPPNHLPPLSKQPTAPSKKGDQIKNSGDTSAAETLKLQKLAQIKSQQGGKKEFGLTADELGEVCSFDKRTNPTQIDLLNQNYGGVDGVGILLKSNLQTGLTLKNANGSSPPLTKQHHKKNVGKVSPDMGVLSHANGESGRDMTAADKDERISAYGINQIPPPRSETIVELVWNTIKDDVIIKVLLVGAFVTLVLGTIMCPSEGWLEGTVIVIAVIIVLSVTAGNDYAKDKKFKKLLLMQSDKRVRVIRSGIKDEISSWDLLVGDVVELTTGDEIPADGLFISGNRLIVDESPLTGESIPVKKSNMAPYMFSGCQVSEGSGLMLITGVGVRSSGGQIQELLNEAQAEETVLQLKLKAVAILIGKIGVTAGILTFLGLTIRWAIYFANNIVSYTRVCSASASPTDAADTSVISRIRQLVNNFVISITVVVVAVPEGLPLAVTISLAFSMFKMIQENCFVRHLDASETMGEATCICTDKTGTLTENKMTVVKVLIGDSKIFNGEGSGEATYAAYSSTTFTNNTMNLISEAICLNSDCFIKINPDNGLDLFVGSATEGALLVLCRKLGINYDDVRKEVRKIPSAIWTFSSERKRMSTLVSPRCIAPIIGNQPNEVSTQVGTKKFRLYSKGASEIILGLCTHYIDIQSSAVHPMTPQTVANLTSVIKSWAAEGLRTIGLAYRDTDIMLSTLDDSGDSDDPEHDLVWIGLVGIKDPLRKEVPGAVAQCQKAGLTVRMVTGDNILTACKIAKECGILHGEHGIALEGPVFRAMSDEEKRAVAPYLQVLARSSPADKHTLVSLLKDMGEVVAVTGDGTNDAPALKEADVGFAMGVAGTQIARNASDIILLDDNFVSLVSSIKWGRNVLNAVRKFLQFQLGVNLVAIFITFIGSFTVGVSPLNTVQLLWVNLIMDTFGALALASDEPDDDILNHPPHARTASLLSPRMREYIMIQFSYQITVLLMILLRADVWFPPDLNFHSHAELITYDGGASQRATTMVFLTFVFLQISNKIMARQLNGQLDFVTKFLKNKLFLLMISIIIFIQCISIIFGGTFLSTAKLSGVEWGICIAFALGNFFYTTLARLISIIIRSKYFPEEQSHREDNLPPPPPLAHMVPAMSKKDDTKEGSVDIASSARFTSPEVSNGTNNAIHTVASAGTDFPHPSIAAISSSKRHSIAGQVHGHGHTKQPTRSKWNTVRSAVVLIGNYQEVQAPSYERRGPDSDFMETWMRFRKDVKLPTKHGQMGSMASLRGSK